MKEKLRRLVSSGIAVHLVELGVAAIPATFAASFFAGATRELGADLARRDAWLEALAAASHGRASTALYGLAIAAALMLLLHAPVQMIWLHRLAGMPAGAAACAGLRRVRAALAVTFLVYTAGLLFAFAAICPAIAAHLALGEHPNVRLHDAVVLALAMPLPMVGFVTAMAHDLARAALVAPSRDSIGAIIAAFRALRPRLAVGYAVFLGASAIALGLATASSFLGGTDAMAALAIFVAHALLFVRTLIRGAWLERCITATPSPWASPGPDDAMRSPDQMARLAG